MVDKRYKVKDKVVDERYNVRDKVVDERYKVRDEVVVEVIICSLMPPLQFSVISGVPD